MRSSLLSLIFAAFFATTVLAHGPNGGGHLKMKRQALRNKRPLYVTEPSSRGRRDATPVVSDTSAAVPGATQSAAGTIVQPVGPIGCSAQVGFGGSCDQASGICCASGLICSGQKCAHLCTLDTTERFCDAESPCDAALGYTCTANQCRPPAGAVRVQTGDTCDQGSGNTRFCIPGRAICSGGTCVPCIQHS
ncbi:uncharacterized protein JCM6883_002106 [Sporobolomyces salmoneus]|uniref:uncharacterized protein n=1 Tax=Sporobolomyces salmoneus TaxID=183962 RepID=UPI00316DB7A4